MFEDVIVADSDEQVAASYYELFEDEAKAEKYKRKLSVTEINRLIGTDGNYYKVEAIKL